MNTTNSPLIDYVKISPNRTSPRNHKIDTVTIHCMAGNLSVERCGEVFAPKARKASSNYGIGSDGRIAMYVEERDRSWCTSSAANDHRAVTIEVANDGGAPDWHVSDKAMAALIELLADICRRNQIKELKWQADPSLIGQVNKQNMTVHRWFAAKACPGNYLYGKHGYIAQQVNHKLNGASSLPEQPLKTDRLKYIYQNVDYARVFDPVFYSNTYPDLKAAFGSDSKKLFDHFCRYGMSEGRIAIASFRVNKYKSYYADLRKAFGNNLPLYYEHYVKYGYQENRKCI